MNLRNPRDYNGALMNAGKQGESAALSFLLQSSGARIEDVRNHPEWQRQDVDFLLHYTDRVASVEVKSDRYISRSGNVLFEIARAHHTANPCAYVGWSVFSAAQHLIVFSPPDGLIYHFRFSDLRAAFQAYVLDSGGKTRVSVVPTDDLRTTFNVLIPLTYCAHNVYTCTAGAWTLNAAKGAQRNEN